MTLDRVPSEANLVDVLDHVLDKGIVVDAWVRVSLAGIDLISVEARVVVASISTYLSYASAIPEPTEPLPETVIMGPRRTRPLQEQLQRIRNQLNTSRVVERPEPRHTENRILDDIRDAHARTMRRRKK